MAEYDNTNSGALFPNDQGDNPKRPQWRGSLNVGGTDYWISGWARTSKNGTDFLSVKVEPKDQQQQAKPKPAAAKQGWGSSRIANREPPPAESDLDDPIPF